ncbi:MAG TPA: hypothetical protein VIV83_03910 [Gemmatimonadales bacterium]
MLPPEKVLEPISTARVVMTESVDQKIPAPTESDNERALLSFSRPARWSVVGGCLIVAELRILWGAPLDALSVGLIGVAVLLIFGRIKEVGWGGFKASFVERELQEISGKVERVELPPGAAEPSPPPTKAPPAPVIIEPQPADAAIEGRAPRILVGRAPILPTNPTERLLWAVEQIRIELILLAGNSGNLPQRVDWKEYRAFPLAKHLVRKGVIPEELGRITSIVSDARNELVHGGLAPEALGRADTIALEFLQKLRAVKRQYVRVRDPNPPLWVDDGLVVPYEGTDGVMLVTLDDEGRMLHLSVYPRSTEYQRGSFVSWEWDLSRGFDEEAVYQHPISGEPTVAWSESATFVGRQYPQEWFLEYRFPRPEAGLE